MILTLFIKIFTPATIIKISLIFSVTLETYFIYCILPRPPLLLLQCRPSPPAIVPLPYRFSLCLPLSLLLPLFPCHCEVMMSVGAVYAEAAGPSRRGRGRAYFMRQVVNHGAKAGAKGD